MDRSGNSEDAAAEGNTATSSPYETHGQPLPSDLAVVQVARWDYRDDGASGDAQPRTWRQALPRWLAMLDSTRTRREYEKAVLYFFQAPGVPELLSDLTFDLLLAYRGSLALRAERRTTRATQSGPSRRPSGPLGHAPGESPWKPSDRRPVVDQHDPAQDDVDSGAAAGQGGSGAGPLAPATVNVRLTALRQFLAHCSLWGLVPQLSPERIHAALRRLSIERRRPYQILAEPEWASFLSARTNRFTLS